jgi:chlorite dismutase
MLYHSYIFFDTEPNLPIMDEIELAKEKQTFVTCVESYSQVHTLAYGMLALKASMRFMLHMETDSLEIIQNLVRDLLHTPLGRYLRITQTFFGMTRPSQYSPSHVPIEITPESTRQYLIIYPFTKTIEWYLLPYEERKKMMHAHIAVGKKFSADISQLLLYSFGIDDQEFIVSYETNTLENFQTLVMQLRETEARRYTQNDTPIFTCIYMPLAQALELI